MAKKMTDADKAKAKIKDTTKTVTKSGRTITSSATSSYPKDIKKGSMASNSKVVEVAPPKKKASAKYSPAPMSAAAKKKTASAGKESMIASVKRGNNKLGIDRTLAGSVKPPKKASTAYSPKPFDTRAAAVKRSEGKRKELASKVVKAVGKTAKYTPMGVVAKGAAKAGRALGKVIPKK